MMMKKTNGREEIKFEYGRDEREVPVSLDIEEGYIKKE
jgi:hypothetical protein